MKTDIRRLCLRRRVTERGYSRLHSPLPEALECQSACHAGFPPPSFSRSPSPCRRRARRAKMDKVPSAANHPAGLILQIGEGERRVRRPKAAGLAGLPDPFIIKVDNLNGGSKDLVMGYEELAPGQAIRPHRHLTADEIIFVHAGG